MLKGKKKKANKAFKLKENNSLIDVGSVFPRFNTHDTHNKCAQLSLLEKGHSFISSVTK